MKIKIQNEYFIIYTNTITLSTRLRLAEIIATYNLDYTYIFDGIIVEGLNENLYQALIHISIEFYFEVI